MLPPCSRAALPHRHLTGTLLVLLLFCFALPPAQAQTARLLTFDEAIDLALERNVTLRRARHNVALQSTAVTGERADFLPNLNLSSTSQRNFGLSFDQTTGRTFSQTSDFVSVGANSSIALFTGFENTASLNQARHALDAEEYTYDRTRQAVLFNVIQSYLQVILDQEQIRIREEDVEAQRQQLARIEEFTRVGARPISDLYQQQATLASSELQLIEAERAVQLSQARVIGVLQLDPFEDYAFVAPSAEEIALVPQTYDAEALLRSAFSLRPDLMAQESSIAAAASGIRAARSGVFPIVSLSGGVGSRFSSVQQRLVGFDIEGNPLVDPNGDLLLEQVPFGTQLTDNRAESITLSVSVPVFNRWRTRTNVERARVQYENARLDLENLQQNVATEVRQAYLDYQTAVKRLDVTEKQNRAAEQALAVEQERYEVGASTLVELQQARATFVQAASNRVQAIYQFHFQAKLIEYYQGAIDPSQPLF